MQRRSPQNSPARGSPAQSSPARTAPPSPSWACLDRAPTPEQLQAEELAAYGAWFNDQGSKACGTYQGNLAQQKHDLALRQSYEASKPEREREALMVAIHAGTEREEALQETAARAAFKNEVLTQWDERSRAQEEGHLDKVGWPRAPGTAEYKAQELKLFADRQLRKTEFTLERSRAKVATVTASPTGHQARSAGRRPGRVTSQGIELKLSNQAQELVDIEQRKAKRQFEIVREAMLNVQKQQGGRVVLPSDAEVAKVLQRIKEGKTGFDD